MTRRWTALGLVVLVLLSGAGRISAQGTATPTPLPTNRPSSSCGLPFNPCGPLPFTLPRPATVALPSPTRIPTLPSPTPVPATATPSHTPTPTPTLTPTDTPTDYTVTPATATITATYDSFVDAFAPMAKGVNDAAATLSWEPTKVLDYNGESMGTTQIAERFGANVGAPIQFLRAIQERFSTMGLIGVVANFMLISLALGIFVNVTTLLAKPLIAIARFVINLIGAIKPF